MIVQGRKIEMTTSKEFLMEEHPSSTKASAHSIAILILRPALGSIFFAHGAQKVFGAFEGRGIEGVIGMTTSFGLPMPVVMAWIVALIEFAGGIAVFIGFFTRIAAAGICINMIKCIGSALLLTLHERNTQFFVILIATYITLI